MITDPIADYLTRIRNGLSAGLATVEVPSSRLKLEISRILTEQGYKYEILYADDLAAYSPELDHATW